MTAKTFKIGAFSVKAKLGHATIVKFTGGAHGRNEAGYFAFWTAKLRRPVSISQRSPIKKIIGRALVGLDCSERFNRMREASKKDRNAANRAIYRMLFHEAMKKGSNVALIRPSTTAEVRKWMKSHSSDAKYARRLR